MLRACSLVWLTIALPALGGDREKLEETAHLLDGLQSGSVSPMVATNRIEFLGTHDFATDSLAELTRKTTDAAKRLRYLEVLSHVAHGSDEAEAIFTRNLSNEDVTGRIASVRGLGRLKASRQLPKVEAMLQDKASGVRREAAKTLGLLGNPRSGAALMASVKKEDDAETRAALLVAVGRCGDKKQLSALEPLLEDSSESTRFAAARALCALGSPKGPAFAKKLLASQDASERVLGVSLFEGAPLKVSSSALTPLLSDAAPRVRAAAARALVDAGDRTKLDWLVVESARAQGEAKLAYENELDTLRLSDEQRAAILKKAGVTK